MKRTPLARRTPLKRTQWIRRSSRSTHAPKARRRRNPARSRAYLDWIRSQPCTVDGCLGRSQAAHTGEHGLGMKAPDWDAIPLCAEHHLWEFPESWHRLGREAFEARYSVNIDAVILSLRTMYSKITI